MALQAKIKHVDRRPNGVLRFRRRFPKDVADHIGQPHLQVHFRNREGVKFAIEHQALMEQWERIVENARAEINRAGTNNRTTHQRWHDAMLAAAGLREGVIGLDPEDSETGRLILETMPASPEPLVVKALLDPTARAPEPTLQDAILLYRQDNRVIEGSREDVGLSRITSRLEAALGSLQDMAMIDLTREHGRTYMQHLLKSKKSDGSVLAVGTAKKEAGIVRAIVNHGLTELDIDAANNPFHGLPWPKESALALDAKLPLPDDLVSSINIRLKNARNSELHLIWSILAATGARLNEIAGLTVGDVFLDHKLPHVLIRPNGVRNLKTKSSVRSVPLTEKAQEAMKAALEGLANLGDETPLFERYARQRGNDALSAVLMKNLRAETKDTRFSVHGLRHRVSDKLREAGAPTEVRQGFLGHANQAIAESVYGGREARLKEFQKWVIFSGL